MIKVIAAAASVISLTASALLMIVIVYLVRSEVIPAVGAGSFDIETSSMILNRVWRGNELYGLLAAYVALALGLAVGGILTARNAIWSKRGRKVWDRTCEKS
jgi:hypothetical protein